MGTHVIHLFGASGSGTTTLGRYLSEKLGYYHMDTDDYFWEKTDPPYTVKRDRETRVALMLADLEKYGNVVISGSLCGWGDRLIPYFTLAIRMVTDTETRVMRLRARERAHFGSRLDPGGDMHEAHLEFIRWASSYDSGGPDMRSKLFHDRWQTLLSCPRITLDGTVAPEENAGEILAFL